MKVFQLSQPYFPLRDRNLTQLFVYGTGREFNAYPFRNLSLNRFISTNTRKQKIQGNPKRPNYFLTSVSIRRSKREESLSSQASIFDSDKKGIELKLLEEELTISRRKKERRKIINSIEKLSDNVSSSASLARHVPIEKKWEIKGDAEISNQILKIESSNSPPQLPEDPKRIVQIEIGKSNKISFNSDVKYTDQMIPEPVLLSSHPPLNNKIARETPLDAFLEVTHISTKFIDKQKESQNEISSHDLDDNSFSNEEPLNKDEIDSFTSFNNSTRTKGDPSKKDEEIPIEENEENENIEDEFDWFPEQKMKINLEKNGD